MQFPSSLVQTYQRIADENACDLATELNIPSTRIDSILAGKSSIRFDEMKRMLAFAMRMKPESEVPSCYLFEHMKLSDFGVVVMGVGLSQTLEQAIDFYLKLQYAVMPSISVWLEEQGDQVIVHFEVHPEFAEYEAVLTESAIASVFLFQQMVMGSNSIIKRVNFFHQQAFAMEKYEKILGKQLYFGASSTSLVFNKRDLSKRMITENQTLQQQLKNDFIEGVIQDVNISTRVRHMIRISLAQGQVIGFDALAKKFNISERTLSRRLLDDGSQFRELYAEEMKFYAEKLMRCQRFSLGEVARRLGFSSHATFSRSYKKVAGCLPSEYQRSVKT